MLRVPVENLIAAFPATVRAGGVALRPLALRDAILLAVYGVDFEWEIRGDFAILAGAVLSGAVTAESLADAGRCVKALARFARAFRRPLFPRSLKALEDAVNTVVDKAFATRIPFLHEGRRVSLSPSGLGWPLELAEALCHEYGWGWEEALATPVAAANALMAAAHRRNGGRFGGPDYIERPIVERMKGGGANG